MSIFKLSIKRKFQIYLSILYILIVYVLIIAYFKRKSAQNIIDAIGDVVYSQVIVSSGPLMDIVENSEIKKHLQIFLNYPFKLLPAYLS